MLHQQLDKISINKTTTDISSESKHKNKAWSRNKDEVNININWYKMNINEQLNVEHITLLNRYN